MNQFTTRQVILLCVLSTCLGAVFSPPRQSVAQPPEPGGASPAPFAETPQPLATPPAASSATRSVTTQAVGTITGQGSTGNIAKFTGANAIGNSVLYETGGKIGLGTTAPTGVFSVNNGTAGVYGIYSASTGNGVGGTSSGAIGVYGLHTASTGAQSGVLGETHSAAANAIGTAGVILSTSPGAGSAGVRGINNGTGGNGYGVYGSQAGSGSGVYGVAPSGNGVLGESASGVGVRGRHNLSSGTLPGVLGETNSTETAAVGIKGIVNPTSPGGSSAGVLGVNNGTSSLGIGVFGSQAGTGYGVYGTAPGGTGVVGASDTGMGVAGLTYKNGGIAGDFHNLDASSLTIGTAVRGLSAAGSTSLIHPGGGYYSAAGEFSGPNGVIGAASYVTGYGVIGIAGGSNGYGIYSSGNALIAGDLDITGTLTKGAGSFKIDHPLHPATEYLSHSFVESPDMMNIYNGNVTTNSRGEAWVQMPDYFQALNREFRYQLTPMGQFAQAIVGKKIAGNRFLIRTDKPNVEVSWLVTGVRHDAYARQHRIRTEETKTGADRGHYLYPAGFGFGKDKQIGAYTRRFAQR